MKVNRILCIATLLVTLSVVGAFAQTPSIDLTPLTAPPKTFRDMKGGFINVGFDPTIQGGIKNMCSNLPEGYGCFTLDKPILGYSQSGKGTWVYGYLPVELPWVQGDDKRTIVIIHLASMKIIRVVACGNRFYHETSLTETKPEPPKPAATPCSTPPPCVPFPEPKVTRSKDEKGNEIVTIEKGCGVVEVHKTTTNTVCEGGYNDLVDPTRNGKAKSFKVKEVLIPSKQLPEDLIRAIWEEMKKDKDVQKRFVKSDDDEKNFNRMMDSKIIFMHVQDSFCEPGKGIRVEILWDSWHWKEFWIGFGVGTVFGRYGIPSRPDKPQVPMKDSSSGGVRTVPNGDPVRGTIAPRDGIRTIESPLGSGTTNGDLPIGRTIGGTPSINPTTGGTTTTVPVRRP